MAVLKVVQTHQRKAFDIFDGPDYNIQDMVLHLCSFGIKIM